MNTKLKFALIIAITILLDLVGCSRYFKNEELTL